MISAFSSSSSSSFMLPLTGGMLAEWTLDRSPILVAVLGTIGQTVQKPAGLLPPIVSLIVDYLEVHKEKRGGVFGEKEWVDHFGSVVPGAPALPPSIEEIWQGPCSIYPGKKISETHMFVYIPATINGHPLTLKSFGILAKKYFPETATDYGYLCDDIVEQLGDQPIGNSCWVLMTNEGLDGSGSKCFIDQQAIVAALAKKTLAAYEVPRALDAAVCILARFASSKIRLFSDTYTRCQENVNVHQVVVGGFAQTGLYLTDCNCYYISDNIVVAALRKFF